ncbi:MAG: GGDEF domain-containing protein [Actinobacteria bacterium]|nr:GGDEF domain-containing protein [Actinomycetota bacterium]
MAAGLVSLCFDALPNGLGANRRTAVIVDCCTVLLGVMIRIVPWDRLPARWLAALPAAALAYLAVNRALGIVPNETYGIWIILIFVWIGLWLPPLASLAFVPFAVLTYLIPFAFIDVPNTDTLASVAISVPVAVIVGETLARRAVEVRRAHAELQTALDSLERANVTDDLTGLGNRRQANQMLDELADGDALAIFDLDHFKRVNDLHGHQYGDGVLNEFGQFLAAQVRDHDTVARYGGEEFIMVLRQAEHSATEIVERLLEQWRTTAPSVTLSVGIAVHRGSWSDTFSRADRALYEAKRSGRDRAVLAAR